MYAYIKYEKKCPRHSEKAIVSVHDIRHFNEKSINYARLYNIHCGPNYCTGLVLMVDETIELLQKKIDSKRIAIPAKKTVESASEVTDSEAQEDTARAKRVSQNKTDIRDIVEAKLSVMKKKYDRLPMDSPKNIAEESSSTSTDETTTLKSHSTVGPGDKTSSTRGQSKPRIISVKSMNKVEVVKAPKIRNVKGNKENIDVLSKSDKDIKKAEEKITRSENPRKLSEDTTDDSESLANQFNTDGKHSTPIDKSACSNSDDSHKTSSTRGQSKPRLISAKSVNKIEVVKATKIRNAKVNKENIDVLSKSDKDIKKAEEKITRSENPTKLSEDTTGDSESLGNQCNTDGKHSTPIDKSACSNGDRSQICSQCQVFVSNEKLLNKKLREASRQIEELKNQKESLRASRDEEREICKGIEILNMELQKNVIDFFNEIKSNSNEVIKQATMHVLQDESAVPVGYERKRNETIHLGHGVWLKKSTYNAVVSNARTPAIFVKNMAVAVFGTSVLAMSSVTGTVSNRNRKKKGEAVKAKPKLNSMKLMAITDIFEHWLMKKGFDKVEIGLYVGKVGTIISHKISDLNRPVQKKNKKEVVQNSEPDTTTEADDLEKETDPADDLESRHSDNGSNHDQSDLSEVNNVTENQTDHGSSESVNCEKTDTNVPPSSPLFYSDMSVDEAT